MIDIFCPHCGFELTEAEVRRWIASLNGRRPKKREKALVEPAWIPGPICKCGRTKECGAAAKRCQRCDGAYTLNDPATDLGCVRREKAHVPAPIPPAVAGPVVVTHCDLEAGVMIMQQKIRRDAVCPHGRVKSLCLACERGRK